MKEFVVLRKIGPDTYLWLTSEVRVETAKRALSLLNSPEESKEFEGSLLVEIIGEFRDGKVYFNR